MSNVTKKNLEVLKKAFAALTVSATVLSLAGFAVALPASAATPGDYGLKEGDVVSAAGSDDPDVYIVNEHGYKRLFLNPAIFGFYGHLGGFAAVKNVSATTRDAFGTSGLFRNCESGDEKVYGVETTGEDVGMLHWVNTTGAQAVADDADFFKKVFCINNNEFNWYAKGSAYTSVNQVPNYTRAPGMSGSMSVGLAADNPVAGTLVDGSAIADLAHFQFTGSGTITKLVFRRIGVSADTTLSNVYLFDGSMRLSDSSTVTSTLVNFNNPNGLFTVSGAKTIKVRSDIAESTSGQTVGLRLESYTMGGVDYSVSVSGNVHTIASATLATAYYATTTTPSAATISPQNDYVMWQNTVTVGTRYVWLKSIRLRQIGSVLPNDLQNFRLLVDGVQVGSAAALDANGYVNFDLGGGVKLETGGRTLKLLGNIVGGSSRTFSFSLQQAGDSELVDNEYGAAVLPTVTDTSTTFSARNTGTMTIGTGTLTITKKTDSPAGDVVKDASGVVLAKWEVKAAGEAMKVEKLKFSVDDDDNDTDFSLRNGAVYWNGVQIGSTKSLAGESDNDTTTTEFTFGSSFIVTPGTPGTLEIRADIFDNDDTNEVAANDTLQVQIDYVASNNNVQRMSSLGYTTYPESAAVDGNVLTVKVGSMTLAKYTAYANQNVTIPNSSLKLGHFVLTGNSSEDVNINTVNVSLDVANQWTADTLSDVYLKITNSSGATVFTSSPKSSWTDATSQSYSVNFTLPKSTAYNVEVWGAVSSFTVAGSNDTIIADMDVDGTTVNSATSVSAELSSNGVGQTLTAEAGSISSAVGGSTPTSKLVLAGTQVPALAIDFTASNDDFTVHQLDFDMAGSNNPEAAVGYVVLKDGSTTLGTLPLNGASVSFTGLTIAVPKNTTKSVSAELILGNVGFGAALTNLNVQLSLDRFKARDSAGTETNSATERNGNALYVRKAYPSVAAVSLPTTVLSDGEQTVSKFTLSANGNTIGVKRLLWTITKAAAATVASNSGTPTTDFKLLEDGVNVQADGTFAAAGLGETTATISFTFTTEKQISTSAAKTYELKLNLGSTATNTSFVTQLKVNSTSAAAAAAFATVDIGADIVWSDRAGGASAAHSESTSDWFNDNLVNSAVSQALVR